MKFVSIVLGMLLFVGGIYCLVTPVATYAAVSWVIGFAMIAEGIGSITTWNMRRKIGFADGWTLVAAIVSVVLGIALLCSMALQYAVDLFIAYMIAIWLVLGGVARIAVALRLRKFHKETGLEPVGLSWGLLLAVGVLIAIMGVLCIIEPVTIMAGVGILLGIGIVLSGAGLIVNGLTQ